MKRIIPTFLPVFLAALNLTVFAGNWTTYTNSDAVRQIVATSDRIWGATSGGIISYNLSSGATDKLTNIDGLKGIDFNCAERDTAGDLWFGGADGWLSNLSPSGAIHNFAFKDSIGFVSRPITLYDLKIDGDRLWVASDLGVSKFLPYSHGGEIKDTARRLGNLPAQEDVVCVAIVGNNLWAGTARGVAFIDRSNLNIQYYGFWRSFGNNEDGLANPDIRCIVDYNGSPVVGTANGIFQLTVSPDTLWQSLGLTGLIISRLFMENSNLLAATNVGIFQYDGASWTGFPSTNLPQGQATDLALDSTMSLWAATPDSGLAALVDTSWVLHTVPGPAGNYIRDLAIDSSGDIWMSHDDRGLSRLSAGAWTIYNSSNSDPDGPGPLGGLADNSEWGITVDPDNGVWVGDWGSGLYRFNRTNSSWDHWTDSNSPMFGLPNYHWYWVAASVTLDRYGNIWVPSLSGDADPNRGGLVMGVFDRDARWQLFYQGDGGMPNNATFYILASDNSVWIARVGGLDRLDFGGTPFDSSDDHWLVSISSEAINDLAADPSGTLWFVSANGLFFVEPGIDTAATIKIPLEMTGTANTVASDGVGDIWVGTTGGIGMLRPDKAEPENSVWAAVFTTANSPLVNDKVRDIAISPRSGQVFIGTEGGLSVFNSGILPANSDLSGMQAYPDPVVISAGNEIVNFQRTPAEGTMSIYSTSGELVARFELSQQRTWNLRNTKQEQVAAGIYIFVVKSGKTSGTGKFAVIR
jgi:ligand-binding sensor domain-containing protein